MARPKNTIPKEQVKIYLDQDLLHALRQDAEEFGLSSAQEIIEQVLKQYRPFWRKVKEAEAAAYQQQAETLLGKETPAPTKSLRRA